MEKLTDAEIMMGLECCSNDDEDNCEQCPYSDKVYEPGRGGCCNQLTDDTLGFIKRLQSENAELKSELTITENDFENAQKLYDESVKISQRMQEKLIQAHKKLQTAKSEAIKEFGKLVIDKIDSGIISHSSDIVDLVAEEIERIAGDKNETRKESDCQTEEAP